MNRLLKKEIKIVPVKVLNMRYCRILERAETMDAKDIPVADAEEILWIEDELRRRLIKYIGHDFYPPDRVETERANPTTKSVLGPEKEINPKPKPGSKIRFPVVVTSSLGSKVAEFTVEVDSKSEADKLIRKEIRKLGLSGATYKIS